jgi:hypothetical protein
LADAAGETRQGGDALKTGAFSWKPMNVSGVSLILSEIGSISHCSQKSIALSRDNIHKPPSVQIEPITAWRGCSSRAGVMSDTSQGSTANGV